MERRAYAKINWDLHILGKRDDGFHELDSVMVNVELFDILRFEPADTITMTCSDPTLPTDDTNLVMRAAKLLAERGGTYKGVRINLLKQIPMGGGMGGGSSDAACTLRALNEFWGLNFSNDILQDIAARLGSDIAFFLYGGWARCTGRGENITPLAGSERFPKVSLLLVLPPLHVATPAVYRNLQAQKWDGKSFLRTLTELEKSLNLELAGLRDAHRESRIKLFNGLTDAARRVEPKLIELQEALERCIPGRWAMSGSGAVHFVVATGPDDSRRLQDALQRAVGTGVRVLPAATCIPDQTGA